MSETLYYEPAYELTLDAQVSEFDNQAPEYINPDWDDNALYDLICANQDVLVDVGGCTMTLSAAMNEHPGPWLPENEANLIAYAEGLLATALVEPSIPEDEKPEIAENEQTLDSYQPENTQAPETLRHVQPVNKPERPEQQEAEMTPAEIPSHSSSQTESEAQSNVPELTVKALMQQEEPSSADTPTMVKVDEGVIDNPVEYTSVRQTQIGKPDRVLETTQSIEVEEQEAREVSQVSQSESALQPAALEVPDAVYIEDDTADDEAEQNNILEQASEVNDEAFMPQAFEVEHEDEMLLDISEHIADELPLDSLPEYTPDAVDADQTDAAEPEQLEEPIKEVAEEAESTFMQLAELIASSAPEDDENIGIILNKILEVPVRFEIETKEEWGKLYTELFEAAGAAYTPELIESLSELSIKWNLVDEIERLESTGYDTLADEDKGARMMVRKLLIAITNIVQTIRHIFAIGTYALRLSVAPRAGYR